ncbi:MAG: histidine phosphatase family protein [Spirochaetaceae bacterium]|nr:MAG: histidine phosphatase family protein [Spirochaetaceae bacterium]
MELYIIRHAQSSNNALLNQTDRVCDPPLTDLGRKQAKRLAHHLATEPHPEQVHGRDPEETAVETVQGYGIKRLYCSAMHRSLETATTVGDAIGVRPEVFVDLHENGGIFLNHRDERGVRGYPGMTRREIESEFPSAIIGDDVDDTGWWDPARGQEDLPSCHGRAIRVARELWRWVDAGETGPVALVSHAGFMEALLKALFERLPGANLTFYHLNTAITRVDLEPDRELLIRYLNRVPHLPQDLVS